MGTQRFALAEASTVNALLECCETFRVFDFEFLGSKEVLTALREADSMESIFFMKRITSMGYFNADLVTTAIASFIRMNSLESLRLRDSLELLDILAKQRLVYKNLGTSIVQSIWSRCNQLQRVACVIALVNLDIPLCSSWDLPDPPPSLHLSIDYTLALVRLVPGPATRDGVCLLVSRCLTNISQDREAVNQLCSLVDNYREKLSIIRYCCFYDFKADVYDRLDDNTKQCLLFATQIAPKSKPVPSEVQKLSQTLFAEKVSHVTGVSVGPFTVDILERDRKIIWDFGKPSKYYVGDDCQKLTSFHRHRTSILKHMGYTVIHIPSWQWIKMKNKKLRSDYCRTNRFLAIRDIREGNFIRSATDSLDPARFDAFQAAQHIREGWTHHGEIVHKKQRPKQQWSWNKPVLPLRVVI